MTSYPLPPSIYFQEALETDESEVHIDLVLLPQAEDQEAEPESNSTPFMEMKTAEDDLMTERSWFERRHTLLLRLLVRDPAEEGLVVILRG